MMIVKVERSFTRPDWDLRDQYGKFCRRVRPAALPTKVREAVMASGRAFFYAEVNGDALEFRQRLAGDPGWDTAGLPRGNRKPQSGRF